MIFKIFNDMITCVLQHSLTYIRSATNQLSPDYIHDKSAERKATCCLEYTSPLTGSEITTLMVIGTAYIGQDTASSQTIVDTIVFERAMYSFLSSTKRTAMDLTSLQGL
jgi:hypothetical protein